MNRMEEYTALLAALEQTPPALEYTLARARARRARARRAFAIPAASLLGAVTAFALAVNLSTPFALAVSQVPVLGELARLLSFSPSLSAAVEHDYVQPVGLEQEADGVTMRVEYLIVDQKQLHILFSLSSEQYENLDVLSTLLSAETGERLEGYSLSSSWSGQGSGELRRMEADFQDGWTVPQELTLHCAVQSWDAAGDREWETLTTFAFPLTIDPSYVQNGRVFQLDQDITLDGQSITVTSVEVYPTHLRLNVADHGENTAWLVGLRFSLLDAQGRRFDPVSGGISAIGSPDSPFLTSYYVESPWFYDTEGLALVITGAKWLDKGLERVEVDLVRPEESRLPEGFALASAERRGNGWVLEFLGPQSGETALDSLFRWTYYSPDGAEHTLGGSGLGHEDGQAGRVYQTMHLLDYPYDTVSLCPAFSRDTELARPVTIQVD